MSIGALGMLETYGLIAAIEGLDSALKAANVTLTGFKYVTGGLVTFFVTGDVGACKAAIAAGEAAAKKVGKVISSLVIPRPAESTTQISSLTERPGGRKRSTGIHRRDFPAKPRTKSEPAPKPEQQSVPESAPVSGAMPEPAVEQASAPALKPETKPAPANDSGNAPKTKAAAPKRAGYTEEELREIKTTDLRRLARGIPNIPLTRIEIRDSKKEPLIKAILEAQENNR
ncbi:MAG: BMC domain-containing protein [Oscillospiraceae bacterium]|nr:BMC domain-containing protein [Oscillospiraceae bacterium]